MAQGMVGVMVGTMAGVQAGRGISMLLAPGT